MQIDGNLVSYPIDTIDTSVDAYWNTATFDSSVTNLYLNYTGGLLILSNDSNITVFSSDSKSESSSIIYRATLEEIRGCKRNYTEELCKVAEETSSYRITDMEKMAWDDFPYSTNSMSEEDCRKSCLQDCNCAGALYVSGDCKKVKFPVKYAKRVADNSSKVFFKVGLKSIKRSSNRSIATAMKPPVVHKTSKKTVVLICVMSVAFITCSSIAIAVSGFFISRSRAVKARMRFGSGNLGLAHELTLRAFSFQEVELCIWAYELLVARELDKLDLGVDVDLENFEKMVMVGIWCIQDEPGIRPSMKSVVSMLEGITGVSVPPNPTSASTSA
ncbi:hypothetical protein OIU78_022643 [Salix suchowensis]|nr:hypothetical protein OIU78_022643 [Salix suchowensis]